MRHDQDVGKEDRCVEIEAAHRLQRHLRRKLRREAEIEERTRRLPRFPVFRKIATGLPHDPDRRRIERLAGKTRRSFERSLTRQQSF